MGTQGFWQWFKVNSDRIFHFENDRKFIFQLISSELKKVNRDITFLIIKSKDSRKKEFVISANGMVEGFPFVQELLRHAPKLDQWSFSAFKPRVGTKSIMNYNKLKLDPKNLFFDYRINDNKIGLTLFIKEYDEHDSRFKGASLMLLDNALGEFDVATKIGFIDFEKLISSKSLHSFDELPHIVDYLSNTQTIWPA